VTLQCKRRAIPSRPLRNGEQAVVGSGAPLTPLGPAGDEWRFPTYNPARLGYMIGGPAVWSWQGPSCARGSPAGTSRTFESHLNAFASRLAGRTEWVPRVRVDDRPVHQAIRNGVAQQHRDSTRSTSRSAEAEACSVCFAHLAGPAPCFGRSPPAIITIRGRVPNLPASTRPTVLKDPLTMIAPRGDIPAAGSCGHRRRYAPDPADIRCIGEGRRSDRLPP